MLVDEELLRDVRMQSFAIFKNCKTNRSKPFELLDARRHLEEALRGLKTFGVSR